MSEEFVKRLLRQIQAGVYDLTNEMHEMRMALCDTHNRVAGMEARFSSMETRLDVRFGNLEERLQRVERHLGVK